MHVDLEPGEEEQEGQPKYRHHRDHEVRIDPSEHAGSDDDTDNDLQNDGRHANPRHEAERHWRHQGDDADDEQIGEPDFGHGYSREE